jgi:hypothetical protein
MTLKESWIKPLLGEYVLSLINFTENNHETLQITKMYILLNTRNGCYLQWPISDLSCSQKIIVHVSIKIFKSWTWWLTSLMNKKALSKKALGKYLNKLALFGWEISYVQKLLIIDYLQLSTAYNKCGITNTAQNILTIFNCIFCIFMTYSTTYCHSNSVSTEHAMNECTMEKIYS